MKTNVRKYGNAPFTVAVVHGGPGAAGEMVPVARELASVRGVLEPLQTASSLEGQIEELKIVLETNGGLPITLIGFSWGAWLGYMAAARYPEIIEKLILIGSGGFEEKYAAITRETRMNRLGEEERMEVESLVELMDNSGAEERRSAFARFGALMAKADAYDPLECGYDGASGIDCQAEIFQGVWKDAAEMRRSGKLLEFGKHIKCPVVAIHGDYDPHPAEGVRKPLSAVLEDFRCIVIRNCGHKPWMERGARDIFFGILEEELR